MPKASRNVPLAAAISVMRSRPRAVSTSATIGTSGSRFAVSVTWSTDSTIASITPPTGVPASAARSSAHHGVPKPLIRTQSVLPAAKPTHDVVAGGVLVFGRDRILDVENDDVSARVHRGLEPVGMRTVDQ